MNVWIDMDNSPHVPLLLPFIKSLEVKGYTIFITARDYAQTIELLTNEGAEFKKIGKHGGGNKFFKIIELISRSIRLMFYARKKKMTFAISHGSRAQALACKILKIPCYIGMDYEHTESRIFSACAAKIWIPELLYPRSLPFIGINSNKVITYKGIKEQFYLQNFIPDKCFYEKIGIPADKVLVVLRPPALTANYHNKKSEEFLDLILKRLAATHNVYTICTPRTIDQRARLKKYESISFRVIDYAMDGKNLVYYADAMISGGGTMNREAAFFGARVYSIFSGKKPMLDLELQNLGLLSFINSEEDCNTIQFQKKKPIKSTFFQSGEDQLEKLIDTITLNLKQKKQS